MELTFFLPFPGALQVLVAVLCPQKGSLGPPHVRDSVVSAFPPQQFPLLAPCRSFPHVERSLYAPFVTDVQEQFCYVSHVFIREWYSL